MAYDFNPNISRIKKWNIFFYILIFFLVSSGGKILHLVTDYYWFVEIGFSSIFKKTFMAQISLWVLGFLISASVIYFNLALAKKNCRKPFVIIGPDASVISPFPMPILSELKQFLYPLLLLLTLLIAFFLGNWASNSWEDVLKFFNAVPFFQKDPLFKQDIGFYIFSLPFYKFLYRFFFAIVLSSLIISAVIYFLSSRIYLSNGKMQIAEDSKNHCAILAGFLVFLLAFSFQLKIFDLVSLQRALSPGAGFSDLHAYLPGLKILRIVAFLSALLLWISPWFFKNRLISSSLIFLVGGTFLVKIYASAIQKFEVSPNEIVKETPFIQLAIENTRNAYGLNQIQELEFDPEANLSLEVLKRNELTINNIRLWDHRPLLTSYGQLQEIRTYYDFLDADNDRYNIDGQYRQVMLSVRELVPESLPSRIWINEHLTYTHGYGVCVGPVNRISPEGLPEFFIKDIPPSSTIELKVTRPEIYFGESRANYSIVKTNAKEFDYPAGDQNVYTTYVGTGGVPVKSFWRRLLFAARFGELKILFSGDITQESRFLYYRSIKERLNKAFPFLRFDQDPYIVINEEGKLFWIMDGYTVTDHYPYSEKVGGINYIRNSLKVTIDAYNGTIGAYISDAKDPLIQTYAKIFPDVFKPMESMPKDLRSHIRYPQTLMNIQARMYATYHMTDPQVFYNKEDLWKIPVRTQGGRSEPMEPYYTIMKLAGLGGKEEFILMVPFTPSKKENMIAWMAARCDEPNYGKLLVYNFPKQKLVYGPQQIESRIDQDAEISKQLTLWDQGGSRVLRGSLLVIPVEKSLFYVQPLYLEASGGGLPELKRIIVAYENSIVMEENFELALVKIFGGRVSSISKEEQGVSPVKEKLEHKALIRETRENFNMAQEALKRGDWAGYGEKIKAVQQFLKELSE